MLGAIIGDIVGSRFEFNNTNRLDFELFTPECSYTDDTICTIAIANALIDGDKDYKKNGYIVGAITILILKVVMVVLSLVG